MAFGKSFGGELHQAGLSGLPVSWSDEGIVFGPEITNAQKEAIQAIADAHDPDTPTIEMVITERERRLAAGFDFDFGDARGVHRIGTTEQDRKGWAEVTDFANALVALGDTTTKITIVTDTGPAQITALEWQTILVAAAQFRQPIWTASFALQAMESIPSNYEEDKFWP